MLGFTFDMVEGVASHWLLRPIQDRPELSHHPSQHLVQARRRSGRHRRPECRAKPASHLEYLLPALWLSAMSLRKVLRRASWDPSGIRERQPTPSYEPRHLP